MASYVFETIEKTHICVMGLLTLSLDKAMVSYPHKENQNINSLNIVM